MGKVSKTDKIKLSIAIPVYNEEKTIIEILKRVTNLPIEFYEIIVIDDASKDNSLNKIHKFRDELVKSNPKFRIIEHRKNLGKGAGIKSALNHATGLYFVVQDADLEYSPEDIVPIINTAIKNDHKVVYGSRFLGKIDNMPMPNYLANKFYNFILRRLYKTNITDMHTCFKMVNTELMKSLNMQSDGFDYATELVSKLLSKGIKIYEVPISFKGRTKKQGKKINYRDGIDCIYKLIKYKYTYKNYD